IDGAALSSFAEKFGIRRTYDDFDAMLEDEALDIVVICTAELLHAPMTIRAASHGPKAIICEKPMAMNLAEADEMISACDRNQVTLVIGHQRRYKPQYARARELVREGAIGRVEHIHASGHARSS